MCELNKLTAEEKQMIIVGLQMRRSYIETGDPCINAESAQKMGKHGPSIKALSVDQMKLIVATEELITRLYKVDFSRDIPF